MSDTISIAEYSLVEFLQSAQQFINKGWVFDFTNNANVPTSFGTLYTAVLIPSETKETKETKDETVTSQVEEAPVVASLEQAVEASDEQVKEEPVLIEEQPKKRGRKPKEEKED